MKNITSNQIKSFQKKVLIFYNKEGRDLPWRKTTNRYFIFVSEIMLQQTQVNRVIKKYNEWIKIFPTIKKLAQANLKDVLFAWSGLGYNSRGKRLWDAAKIIVEKYNGIIPETVEELKTLPGIGPYTARSILIFADNKNIATVDTNIRRIFIHQFKLNEKISDKELFSLAEKLLPKNKSRDWHNGLMDYGQVITARKTGIKPKTQQSTFNGSHRQYRAKIVKYLTTKESITLQKAKKEFSESPYNLKEILTELEEEGIIKKEGMKYLIS